MWLIVVIYLITLIILLTAFLFIYFTHNFKKSESRSPECQFRSPLFIELLAKGLKNEIPNFFRL